jgi:hypothetical protein
LRPTDTAGFGEENVYMELLIGTLRHELSKQMLIIGIRHLRQVLVSYPTDFNEVSFRNGKEALI